MRFFGRYHDSIAARIDQETVLHIKPEWDDSHVGTIEAFCGLFSSAFTNGLVSNRTTKGIEVVGCVGGEEGRWNFYAAAVDGDCCGCEGVMLACALKTFPGQSLEPVYQAALAIKGQQTSEHECSYVCFEVWNHVLPLRGSWSGGKLLHALKGRERSNAQVQILLIRNADILAFQHIRSQC